MHEKTAAGIHRRIAGHGYAVRVDGRGQTTGVGSVGINPAAISRCTVSRVDGSVAADCRIMYVRISVG